MNPDRQAELNALTAAPGQTTNVCPQCGASFHCGMEAGDEECWCARLPPLLPLPESGGATAGCYCPGCLQARLALSDQA